MKFTYLKLALVLAVLLNFSCSNKATNTTAGIESVSYIENNEDFPNPERGFYRASSTRTSSFEPLKRSELITYRSNQTISRANYQVSSTLLFRYYAFDTFTDKALSADILEKLDQDMEEVRQAGIKIIPRFVYTTRATKGECPEGFICPPYKDAPKEIVLQHIAQLKPLLYKNADVIACVQMGFIGTWGENYYTDYFGDASSNGKQGNQLNDKNWQDRIDILRALLAAVPKERMIQVRYPQFIQKYVNGINAALDVQPLNSKEAFSESDAARIGLHNDCFLSGRNDVGTYEDYGTSSTRRVSDTSVLVQLRNYMKARGQYTVIGGETCMDSYSPQNDCEPMGRAEGEIAMMGYSFLNAHYNNLVNNDWQDGGCMDNIKRKLGYRFVLKQASIPQRVTGGSRSNVTIALSNKGYTSPYNKRPVELILRGVDNTGFYKQVIETEIQRWHPGDINLKIALTTPADLPKGRYEVLLNLPDPYPTIAKRPEYSIRLANNEVWEESTGYNKLLHTITIN